MLGFSPALAAALSRKPPFRVGLRLGCAEHVRDRQALVAYPVVLAYILSAACMRGRCAGGWCTRTRPTPCRRTRVARSCGMGIPPATVAVLTQHLAKGPRLRIPPPAKAGGLLATFD